MTPRTPPNLPIRHKAKFSNDQRLPEGKTCAQCFHSATCEATFAGQTQHAIDCVHSPSRFIPIASLNTNK